MPFVDFRYSVTGETAAAFLASALLRHAFETGIESVINSATTIGAAVVQITAVNPAVRIAYLSLTFSRRAQMLIIVIISMPRFVMSTSIDEFDAPAYLATQQLSRISHTTGDMVQLLTRSFLEQQSG